MSVWLYSKFLLTFAFTALPVLLPYKPPGSEELFYVPQTEANFSSTESSHTTMESTHTGTFTSNLILLSLLNLDQGHSLKVDDLKSVKRHVIIHVISSVSSDSLEFCT